MRGLLAIGATVSCSEEAVGELADLVADPARNQVTYLVVEPKHLPGGARLVSLELVSEIHIRSGILLDCPLSTVQQLPEVQQVSQQRLGEDPHASPDWDVGVREVMSMPFYDPGALVEYSPAADPEILVVYDRIPKGQVEVRRTSPVTTSDGGEVGHVAGLYVDNGEIRDFVVERKHLGRTRVAAIPAADVLELATDSVTLQLTGDEIDGLHWRRPPDDWDR